MQLMKWNSTFSFQIKHRDLVFHSPCAAFKIEMSALFNNTNLCVKFSPPLNLLVRSKTALIKTSMLIKRILEVRGHKNYPGRLKSTTSLKQHSWTNLLTLLFNCCEMWTFECRFTIPNNNIYTASILQRGIYLWAQITNLYRPFPAIKTVIQTERDLEIIHWTSSFKNETFLRWIYRMTEWKCCRKLFGITFKYF